MGFWRKGREEVEEMGELLDRGEEKDGLGCGGGDVKSRRFLQGVKCKRVKQISDVF